MQWTFAGISEQQISLQAIAAIAVVACEQHPHRQLRTCGSCPLETLALHFHALARILRLSRHWEHQSGEDMKPRTQDQSNVPVSCRQVASSITDSPSSTPRVDVSRLVDCNLSASSQLHLGCARGVSAVPQSGESIPTAGIFTIFAGALLRGLRWYAVKLRRKLKVWPAAICMFQLYP